MLHQSVVGGGLGVGVDDGVRCRVVGVGSEVLDRAPAGVGPLTAVRRLHSDCGTMQVVGREVRSEIGAVAENGAELHHAVAQEHLLAIAHILAGEQHLAGRRDDAVGDRRVGLVGASGHEAEHGETEDADQRHRLDPPLAHHPVGARQDMPAHVSRCRHTLDRHRGYLLPWSEAGSPGSGANRRLSTPVG